PSVLSAAVPAELESIIMKALSNKPADRYASCDEMRVALEQYAEAQNMRTSTTALADYMKQQFGTRREPWLEDATPDEAEIEITGSSPLDLVLELKLPDAEPDDDLAVPIEETVLPQGMPPIALDGGAQERARRETIPQKPTAIPVAASWNKGLSNRVKSTLPLRALQILPARAATPNIVPAVQFPEDDEPEVARTPVAVEPAMLQRL